MKRRIIYQPWPFKPVASPRSLFRYQKPPYVRAVRRRDRSRSKLLLAALFLALVSFLIHGAILIAPPRLSSPQSTILSTDHN